MFEWVLNMSLEGIKINVDLVRRRIVRQQTTDRLSVFDDFVRLALKGLKIH